MRTPPPVVRVNVPVPGARGTVLATDVYRPAGNDPVPVVLIRTPYGKSGHMPEALGWTRHGFGCVVQDVRGRYESEGWWRPYRDEREDGAAVIAWLGTQRWTDGRVVACGASYAAFTAWAAAVEAPSVVRAVISQVPAMGLAHVMFDPSGILRLADHTDWWLTHADGRVTRPEMSQSMVMAMPDLLEHLPVNDVADRFWADLPGWAAVIKAGADDHSPGCIDDQELERLATPVLHIGGWHDRFLTMTLRQWDLAGRSVHPRPGRELLLGPWTHHLGSTGLTVVGCRDYGPGSRLPLGELQVEWIRRVFAPSSATSAGTDGGAGVRVFVMGEDRWLCGDQWPPSPRGEAIFYAGPGGQLGRTPAAAGTDVFSYDPRRPFPSRPPASDRRDLDERADAARFISRQLTQPLTIAGTPEVIVYAATSAQHTDWLARLVEQRADGRLLELASGCVDTQRVGSQRVQSASPIAYRIELDPIALTVPAGSCLRLEITSSDFPALARNLNNGLDRYTSAEIATARQFVHFGGSAATRIILPLLGQT